MIKTKSDRNHELPGPLDGIRILEYGVFHAGPGGCAILGDMGAEIIKIETENGDPERKWVRVGGMSFEMPHGRSMMYDFSNRNKRGITLNIKNPKGREIFNKLLEKSDVFLTNLRKSTKKKLGIDYDSIAKINPKIIHANVSGYGPKGPVADIGAFDPMGQARGGMMFSSGFEDPVLMQLAILDQATAIAASHAMISALLVRERTGKGQEVHVSLYGTATWLMYANLMACSLLKLDSNLPWKRSHNPPLRNSFCCKDGKWIMGVHHPPMKYWPLFCKSIGNESLTDDPRFNTEEKQLKNCPELVEICDKIFLEKTRDEWIEILQGNGLIFSPVFTFPEILKDEQAHINDYIIDFDDPDFGRIKMPGYPIHFSKNSAGQKKIAPKFDQHTDEVLTELGFTKDDINRFRQDKVIFGENK